MFIQGDALRASEHRQIEGYLYEITHLSGKLFGSTYLQINIHLPYTLVILTLGIFLEK
jgi:hypothetical protein